MGTKKIAVSQRWDPPIIELVKDGSNLLGVSQTQFTVEAIKVYSALLENPDFRSLSLEKKIEALQSFSVGTSQTRNKNNKRPPGYIFDLVKKYLENNPGVIFSTNEIAETLVVPQPTVRTYVRKLSNEDERFKLYPGRPNRIQYEP